MAMIHQGTDIIQARPGLPIHALGVLGAQLATGRDAAPVATARGSRGARVASGDVDVVVKRSHPIFEDGATGSVGASRTGCAVTVAAASAPTRSATTRPPTAPWRLPSAPAPAAPTSTPASSSSRRAGCAP